MRKKLAIVLATVVLAVATSGSVYAVTQGPYSQTVSCDATITDTLGTFYQASTGTLSFIKMADTNNITQAVNAYSANGNSVGWKTVGASGQLDWANVLSSYYTFKIHPSASVNCNGWLPGDGNTNLTYKVSHT